MSSIFISMSMDKKQTYPMFLDGHISEVNKHVVQFTGAGCVLDCAEPAEAKLVPEDQTTERDQSQQLLPLFISSIKRSIILLFSL